MEGVAHISNPVRRDAVDIAKDILRKLKVSIGNAQVVDGLQMKPSDDLAALGAVKGVAMVYERLVAWARGNNDTSIFQHPSVIAATQAIGQLGYQAKREGLRLATMAGNHELAKTIGDQLERLPASFGAGASGKRFGELLEAVESGINAIIYRTQQVGVDGAKVGFSVDSTLGSTLSSSPTAGTSNQVGVDNAAQRNAQAAVADQLAAQAQAQRINSQLAAQARTQQAQGQQQQQQQPTQPTPRGGTVGRQSLQAAQSARTQQRQTSATTTSTTPPATAPLNAAQQQAAARHATATALAAAREREEQQARFNQQQAQRQTQQIVQQKAAAKAASKIDPSLLKGFQNATDMKGVTGAPIVGGRRIDPKSVQASMNKPATPPQTQATSKPQTDEEKHLNQYAVQPPTPTRPTGGRGF
jgi:hypothetical protein